MKFQIGKLQGNRKIKSVEKLIYTTNKLIDIIWKLNK